MFSVLSVDGRIMGLIFVISKYQILRVPGIKQNSALSNTTTIFIFYIHLTLVALVEKSVRLANPNPKGIRCSSNVTGWHPAKIPLSIATHAKAYANPMQNQTIQNNRTAVTVAVTVFRTRLLYIPPPFPTPDCAHFY